MVIFYKKDNEIQLTKNKMDLNIRKMINRPPYPQLHSAIKASSMQYYYYNWYYDHFMNFAYYSGRPNLIFSMAIENWELVHECSPEHLRIGTVISK